MKSQARKKRIAREVARTKAVEEARLKNPNLMRLYSAFLPSFMKKSHPKYSTDKYGNRVLTKSLEMVNG